VSYAFRVTGITLGSLAVVALIIGFVGLGLYVTQLQDVKTYKQSDCTVIDQQINDRTCSTDQCYGSSNGQTCSTIYYTCYQPAWEVQYEAQGATQTSTINSGQYYDFYSSAQDTVDDYQIGSEYTCYYDSTAVDNVSWTFPDPLPYLIMLIVCFAFVGLSCLIVGCWFLVAVIMKGRD